jgi:hypothetical protein
VRRIRTALTARREAPPPTPPLRQVHETECGVVALAIVLAHHGAWVPLPELRRRCQVSEHGVNAMSLVQTGKHYGLAVRAMRIRAADLRHVQAPVILFWEHQHFLVLEGIRNDTVWVNDPARGRRTLSLAALGKGYSGVALIAQPGPAFRPMGGPQQPLRTVLEMLQPGRWWLALMGVAVLAESVLLPVVILLVGDAIGDQMDGRAADWRSLALALPGLLAAGKSQLWLTEVALGAVARPTIRRLLDDLADAPAPFIQLRLPAELAGRLQLAEYPGMTAVRIVAAGIRLAVAVPLLVLVLGHIQPLAGIVALPVLATPFLSQHLTSRAGAGYQGRTGGELAEPSEQETRIHWQNPQAPASGSPLTATSDPVFSQSSVPPVKARTVTLRHRLVMWWPILRPCALLSPVVVVGVLAASDSEALPSLIVALLASWFAFRLVESASDSIGMLYMLPESIVQLLDIALKRDVAERAA